MNRYVAQGDGFPGDNEFLMLIQSIIGEVAKLSAIGGDNYILKGCVDTAGVVTAGWMVLDNEIVEFEGGALGTKVHIEETIENTTYLEDINPIDGQGDSKPTYYYRKAKFGTTGTNWNWADLERVKPVIDLQNAIMPVGGIIMWSGTIANIPTGWALCDGTNGTPNLKGKFVVGYDPDDTDYDAIGNQGGSKTHTLTENEMPQHNHTGNINIPSHRHGLKDGTGGSGTNSIKGNSGNDPNLSGQDSSSTFVNDSRLMQAAGGGSFGFATGQKGGDQPHENRPTYYTVAYIQYKGV